ncbi:Bug family tripartite tricarboxylate transporter substrate binding protein [Variovorax sp. LT1R16]|uniref:Bug family tripartite tricarboxylate transporter substrate binding protein n=1 Tax=Variovorax sp. LT1R16 TaxID=3443728 RepID=UPI003F47CDA7
MLSFISRGLAFIAAGCVAVASLAQAPAWVPPGPIRLVVPYAPGGGTDVLARLVASQVGSALGQPLIVENRPGVNGILGANYVYGAQANGTTLLFAAADFISVSPHIYKKAVKYDPDGFKPVALVAKMGFVMASKPSNETRDVADFVAKARGKEVTYAHWGPGSMSQMGMELLRSKAEGVKALQVPYAGAAPMMSAVMSGEVEYGFVPTPLAVAGRTKLKLYALGSPERFPGLPDVPTLKELGYAIDADTWFGILAPPQTPPAVIEALQAQIDKVVKDPSARTRMTEIGYTPSNIEPREFGAFVKSENTRWGAVVRAANIKVEE